MNIGAYNLHIDVEDRVACQGMKPILFMAMNILNFHWTPRILLVWNSWNESSWKCVCVGTWCNVASATKRGIKTMSSEWTYQNQSWKYTCSYCSCVYIMSVQSPDSMIYLIDLLHSADCWTITWWVASQTFWPMSMFYCLQYPHKAFCWPRTAPRYYLTKQQIQ